MNNFSFEDYCYFPSLRSRLAELRGLEAVDKKDKLTMLPILTLGEWPRAPDFERSFTASQKAMENLPFLIDITQDPTRLKEQRRALLDPSDGYAYWVDFAKDCGNAIPVALFTKNPKIREVTTQVKNIEKNIGKVALRVRDFNTEPLLAVTALSAMDDPKNALIILDAQYITRSSLSNELEEVRRALQTIVNEFPEITICVLGTSFPRSLVPLLNEQGTEGSLPILERDLYESLNDEYRIMYGDHASVHSTVYDDQPGIRRVAPRIDYPLLRSWSIQRRSGTISNKEGYRLCAEAITNKHPCLNPSSSWGEKMILEAAKEPFAADAQSWISVRVNIHLTKQARECKRAQEEDFD